MNKTFIQELSTLGRGIHDYVEAVDRQMETKVAHGIVLDPNVLGKESVRDFVMMLSCHETQAALGSGPLPL